MGGCLAKFLDKTGLWWSDRLSGKPAGHWGLLCAFPELEVCSICHMPARIWFFCVQL